MKFSARHLRWIFLGLYVLLVAGLFTAAYTAGNALPWWLWPLGSLHHEIVPLAIVVLVTIVSQLLFIFGAGTVNLCRPLRRPRLLVPVITASVLMAVLAGGALAALQELFYLDENNALLLWAFWTFIGLNWAGWTIAFFIAFRETPRLRAARKLVLGLLAGSLAELLIAVPAHLVVSRRPSCFVGASTGIGVTAGLAVMLWAFGPGLVLLLLHEKHQREARRQARQEGAGGNVE